VDHLRGRDVGERERPDEVLEGRGYSSGWGDDTDPRTNAKAGCFAHPLLFETQANARNALRARPLRASDWGRYGAGVRAECVTRSSKTGADPCERRPVVPFALAGFAAGCPSLNTAAGALPLLRTREYRTTPQVIMHVFLLRSVRWMRQSEGGGFSPHLARPSRNRGKGRGDWRWEPRTSPPLTWARGLQPVTRARACALSAHRDTGPSRTPGHLREDRHYVLAH